MIDCGVDKYGDYKCDRVWINWDNVIRWIGIRD